MFEDCHGKRDSSLTESNLSIRNPPMQNKIVAQCRCCLWFWLATFAPVPAADAAEPYRPEHGGIVLERLPWRAVADDVRQLDRLRKAAAAQPGDVGSAVALARHAFLLAMAHGDPRWAGMGEAALKPWWDQADAPVDVLFLRALLKQYRHEFDAALVDLGKAGAADPTRADIRSWRVAIRLVKADIAGARGDCEEMKRTGNPQDVRECRAWIDGVSGNAQRAYDEFKKLLVENRDASAGNRRWLHLQLAENAVRLGSPGDAEVGFRAAYEIAGPDHASLIGLTDFLLDQGRYQEVESLLGPQYQSDSALLRRAIARKKRNDGRWRDDASQLGERYKAARMRAESLRENDEARLMLDLHERPAEALALAQSNWRFQREAADARVLLEAAIAARQPKAAEPALKWLEETGIQDPRLIHLARLLKAPG